MRNTDLESVLFPVTLQPIFLYNRNKPIQDFAAVVLKFDPKELNGILVEKNSKNKPDYFTGYLYNCGIFNCIITDTFRTELLNKLR